METLGVDSTLIVAQIISFTLLFLVLNRFLFPKIQAALKSRHQAIKDTFDAKEEIEIRLKELETAQKKQTEATHQEMKSLLHQAKVDAQRMKDEILEEGKQLAKKERETVLKQIEQDKDSAKQDLQKYAKEIAKDMFDQMLNQKASDAKWQKDQISASLTSLKKLHE